MKLLFDTTILVDIDRQHTDTVQLLQDLTQSSHTLCVSSVTVAELLTGALLRVDKEKSTQRCREILNQFIWIPVDGAVAQVTATLTANLFKLSKQDAVEYQDILISATSLAAGCDMLITLNTKDFALLGTNVCTPKELRNHLE